MATDLPATTVLALLPAEGSTGITGTVGSANPPLRVPVPSGANPVIVTAPGTVSVVGSSPPLPSPLLSPLTPVVPVTSTGVTAQSLANTYAITILGIVQSVQAQGEAAIPVIIVQLLTTIVPNMVADVGMLEELSATDKKALIVQAIDLGIDQAFAQLAKNPAFKNDAASDVLLKNMLENGVPALFDVFVSIENDEMVVNATLKSCWGKFTSCFC